MKKYCVEWDP